jgi:hypothetical protein
VKLSDKGPKLSGRAELDAAPSPGAAGSTAQPTAPRTNAYPLRWCHLGSGEYRVDQVRCGSGPTNNDTGESAMTDDQHSAVDPTTKHLQPDTGGEKIAHPGLTVDMSEEPDHGEDSYRGSGKLKGRKAVITGGDSGIGRAVALAFAREGADVLISYLDAEEQDAQETVRLIEQAGQVALGAGEEPALPVGDGGVISGFPSRRTVQARCRRPGRRRFGSGRTARRCRFGRRAPGHRVASTGSVVRHTSSHMTAALTALGVSADRERAMTGHQYRADLLFRSVSTMPRPIELSPTEGEWPDRDVTAEFVDRHGQHAGHRSA